MDKRITTILWPTPRNIIKKAMQLKDRNGFNAHCYFVISSKTLDQVENKDWVLTMRPQSSGTPMCMIYPQCRGLAWLLKRAIESIKKSGYTGEDSVYIGDENASGPLVPDVYGRMVTRENLKESLMGRIGFANLTVDGDLWYKKDPNIMVGTIASIIAAIAGIIAILK